MRKGILSRDSETVFSKFFSQEVNSNIQFLLDEIERDNSISDNKLKQICSNMTQEQEQIIVCWIKKLGLSEQNQNTPHDTQTIEKKRKQEDLKHFISTLGTKNDRVVKTKKKSKKSKRSMFNMNPSPENMYFNQLKVYSLLSKEEEELIMDRIDMATKKIKTVILSCLWTLKQFDSRLKKIYDLSFKTPTSLDEEEYLDEKDDGASEIIEKFKLWVRSSQNKSHAVHKNNETLKTEYVFDNEDVDKNKQNQLLEKMALELNKLKKTLILNPKLDQKELVDQQDSLIKLIDKLDFPFEIFEKLGLELKEMIQNLMLKKCCLSIVQYELKKKQLKLKKQEELILIKDELRNEIHQTESLLGKNERIQQKWMSELNSYFFQINQLRYQLVVSNLRLVIYIANKYRMSFPKATLVDLIQEGNLGLMRAVKLFDHRKGRLANYASWWIYQSMGQGLAKQSHLIWVPIPVSTKIRRFAKAFELLHDSGKKPNLNNLSQYLGWDEEDVEKIYHYYLRMQSPLSFQVTVGKDDESNLGDMLPDKTVEIEKEANMNYFKTQLESFLNQLPYREEQILKLRYGLWDGSFYTLNETAEKFGISRERVRQLENRAILKLKNMPGLRLLKNVSA